MADRSVWRYELGLASHAVSVPVLRSDALIMDGVPSFRHISGSTGGVFIASRDVLIKGDPVRLLTVFHDCMICHSIFLPPAYLLIPEGRDVSIDDLIVTPEMMEQTPDSYKAYPRLPVYWICRGCYVQPRRIQQSLVRLTLNQAVRLIQQRVRNLPVSSVCGFCRRNFMLIDDRGVLLHWRAASMNPLSSDGKVITFACRLCAAALSALYNRRPLRLRHLDEYDGCALWFRHNIDYSVIFHTAYLTERVVDALHGILMREPLARSDPSKSSAIYRAEPLKHRRATIMVVVRSHYHLSPLRRDLNFGIYDYDSAKVYLRNLL